MPVAPDQLELHSLSGLFRALGDETRLRLVALLSHGELCVCHLQAALALPQPHVSRHLALLRAAGVVSDRRQGPWVYYHLVEQDDPERERVLRTLVDGFARRDAVRRDVTRLKRACGPGAG